MGKLQEKAAVITKGTTGIGLASANLIVNEGACAFMTCRRKRELDEAVKAIGGNVTGVQGKVAKLAHQDRLDETIGKKGRLDIVFASLGEFAPLGSITKECFDKLFNINAKGALRHRHRTVRRWRPSAGPIDGAYIVVQL